MGEVADKVKVLEKTVAFQSELIRDQTKLILELQGRLNKIEEDVGVVDARVMSLEERVFEGDQGFPESEPYSEEPPKSGRRESEPGVKFFSEQQEQE